MNERYILLVEDNPDDEVLTLRALRSSRVANQVVVAHDGVEALELLLGEGTAPGGVDLPQVVLLDLKLPAIATPVKQQSHSSDHE